MGICSLYVHGKLLLSQLWLFVTTRAERRQTQFFFLLFKSSYDSHHLTTTYWVKQQMVRILMVIIVILMVHYLNTLHNVAISTVGKWSLQLNTHIWLQKNGTRCGFYCAKLEIPLSPVCFIVERHCSKHLACPCRALIWFCWCIQWICIIGLAYLLLYWFDFSYNY